MIGDTIDWKRGMWVRCWCGMDGDPHGDIETDCRQVGVVVDEPVKGFCAVHWYRLSEEGCWQENTGWGLRWCEPYTPTDEEVLSHMKWLIARR